MVCRLHTHYVRTELDARITTKGGSLTSNAGRRPAGQVQLEMKQVNEAKLMTANTNTDLQPMVARSHSDDLPDSERSKSGMDGMSGTHWEIVDICVRSAQVMGVPRSIGEIFGLVFCSPRPVSFDDVVRILKLSNGTASYGLRYLKRLGAIRTCYVARERKDFYVAETSLRKVMSAVFSENLVAHLGGSAERLERLRSAAAQESDESNVLYCVDQLIGWNQQLRRAVIKGFESLR